MTVRFKTFREFNKRILLVHRDDGGINVVSRNPPMLITSCNVKPWNSKETKKYYLVKLYIHKVLIQGRLPRLSLAKGYEALGQRCRHLSIEHVILDKWQAAHSETGEMQMIYKIYPTRSVHMITASHPFDVTEQQIELL